MISAISLKNVWGLPEYKFLENLPALQFLKDGELNFTPGLNILHAKNGAGKSTILKVMADVTASYQGGVSSLTGTWYSEPIVEAVRNGMEYPIKWDGTCVMYSNPRNMVGLVGGGAAFDSDFFDKGMQNVMSKSSTGLTTLERQAEIFEILLGKRKFPTSITAKEGRTLDFTPNIPVGNPTILLDEPESGLNLDYQNKLFNYIIQSGVDNGFQIIVATHSPFSLPIKANHIDLTKGYRIKELAAISSIFDKS